MNKILNYAVIAACLFSVISCNRENPVECDYVTAKITVQSPLSADTKATIGDGTKALNLVFAVYPYDLTDTDASASSAELSELRQGDWTKQQPEIVFNSLETTVSVNLVRGKAYQFVCWAQNKDAKCFDFTDMHAIEVDYADAISQDDLRDAFYSHDLTLGKDGKPGVVTEGFSQTITLNRPFAQVNVGADDMEDAFAAGLDTTAVKSSMTVKAVPNVLKTLENSVEGSVDAVFSIDSAVTGAEGSEVLVVNGDKTHPYGWLAMNYVLVSPDDQAGNGANHDVFFTLYDGKVDPAAELCTYEVNNVSLRQNYRTHLLGNVLTAEGSISIIIDPNFENDDIEVEIDDDDLSSN